MVHTEETFEINIVNDLVEIGYIERKADQFDREKCLDIELIIDFIKSTQEKAWDKLVKVHRENAEDNLIKRICNELNKQGTLKVLRDGINDHGVSVRLAYFKPESGLNVRLHELYEKNTLSVTRQVKYTPKNENELDLVLSINGLPVSTVELKNQMTGQNYENAIKQYKYDREPKELMFDFKKRALVHFAIDDEQAWFATRLSGGKTRFFPFNKGYNYGAGNPPPVDGDYKTSYVWKEIWAKDSWMELFQRFLHLQIEEEKEPVTGKVTKTEVMLFPRYHQLDVVRALSKDTYDNGAGKNYLVQHSAGSGKSNSIAWLSYRLSSLHNENDERVFDVVIVITDRKVLDSQLQNTIYQFEHKTGVVQKIDKNSQQLAEAIYNGSNIVITTLQKFPFVIEKIKEMEEEKGDKKERKYAVIVDEAHSSQGGEASKKLKEVLAATSEEEALSLEEDLDNLEDYEENIVKSMMARGQKSNLSFFAFTATPKAKTLEVFGVRDADGKPFPAHLYSMKQAIEEGFIIDVLNGYTTYDTYYKLSKAILDDPEIDKKKANKAIGRFLSLHPHNIAQKVEVIVEHFRQVASHRIGGKAKAMIVTGSRLHAVRYHRELKEYIKEKGYTNMNALVAFSGKVLDDGAEYTEVQLNSFSEKELPEKFKLPDNKMLVVANKYQTGFDQPLLQTMYVDKVLSGVTAVQTLSRLNRISKGKDGTFILDFVNSPDDIKSAFEPYYKQTQVDETVDINHLWDLKSKIEEPGIIWQSEIDGFCKIFFSDDYKKEDQPKLYALLNPAKERFAAQLSIEVIEGRISQEDYKHTLIKFTRAYSFISQIMPFPSMDMEKLFTYCKFLIPKLPRNAKGDMFALDEEIALEYYRLQKQDERNISLSGDDALFTGGGGGAAKDKKDEKDKLSNIINKINEITGTDFQPEDRLFVEQLVEAYANNEELQKVVRNKDNGLEQFKHPFKEIYNDLLIEKMDVNEKIFNYAMDLDSDVGKMLFNHMMSSAFGQMRKEV